MSEKYTFLWGNCQPAYTFDWNIDSIVRYPDYSWNQISNIITISKKGVVSCFHSTKDLLNDIERGKLFLDEEYAKEFVKNLEQNYKEHWEFFNILKKVDFAKKTDEELVALFEEAMDKCSKSIMYFRPTQQEGTTYLMKYFKDGLSDEEVSLIAKPLSLDIAMQEQKDWQKIIIDKNKDKTVLMAHVVKYPWIVMSHATYEEVLDTLNEKYNYDVANLRIRDFDKERKELEKEQAKVFSKNNKIDKKLVSLVQRLALSRMEVKSCWASTDFYLIPLFAEISKRANEPVRDLYRYYLINEIRILVLNNKKLSSDEKRKRYEFFVCLWKDGKKQYFSGRQAEKVAKKELGDLFFANSEETHIKGTVANPGKAVEKAVILNANDVEQTKSVRQSFKRGEILITQMTQPNIMDIASRAGAIVTDEGGLLSHAAIISRELGIPCIVGTHKATQAIKTGDSIEVDADKGIITILKHSKEKI